jgi:RimJ/RimL family protein N-acetyltransferase
MTQSAERIDAERDGLAFPAEGVRHGDILLRLPTLEDVPTLAPAFADPEIAVPGNLPSLGEDELRAFVREVLHAWMASGRLLPLVVCNGSGEIAGGGTLHHLDRERSIVELGYWLFPQARGRGVATQVARMLAEHAFSLGIARVTAMVDVGHVASERVLERAGFTREGVLRSMPRTDGTRTDRTIFSILPADG